MTRFRHHLIDLERDTKNRVITRETAISTIVDALVGQVKRREEAHRSAKILQRQRSRHLRHRFEFTVGLRADQMLEPIDELRFPESQVV